MVLTRRQVLGAVPAAGLTAAGLPAFADNPFQPSWDCLAAQYRTPDWFRDAKLGLWAHWGPQCVPEAGDWYGRFMYKQGHRMYDHHLKHYGHPSDTGFIDLIGRWRAEKWDPRDVMARFKSAGARYVVSMAQHHDNFDCFDSRYHAWNSTRVGPKRDIVGTWEKLARQAGLRFGISNHGAHAWHWFQTAYGYDPEGAKAGIRYDANRLTRADGKGTWWDGLDPQDLYGGPMRVPPAGLTSIKAMDDWHDVHTGQWLETPPPGNPAFVRSWYLRALDAIEKYRPDLVYFDNYGLPFGQVGLDITARYYNLSRQWHGGRLEAVVNGKRLAEDRQRKAIVEDHERSFVDEIRPDPWQTCTCIGQWHYDRALYDRGGYKSVTQVVQSLSDIVSKNGNLLLSIPMRGDGSLDDLEIRFLDGLAAWTATNGEAIFGTRPWRRYGEGPTRIDKSETKQAPFTSADLRFTTRGGNLYALAMAWPADGKLTITSLAGTAVDRADLLGRDGTPLPLRQTAAGLEITLPEAPNTTPMLAVRLSGRGLI
ncbi:alpha-L-fucosidase [Niveispirillum sp. KHB5.9]|uniref:alpha-L-fucosidase n=1 Tax=Niveispirillum sp. KHB5.9 TaxID=3400269 RepID=UPI003A8C0700